MTEYALLGGGGLAIELFDYMSTEGKKFVGYYDLKEDKNLSTQLPYLGNERDENNKISKKIHYIVASGLLAIRRKMIDFIESKDLIAGTFISQKAYVSKLAKIGKGAVVAPFSMLTGNTCAGDYVLFNINSIAAHDAKIGNNVVIGPGVIITGHCTVKNNVTFGANSALVPSTSIGSNVELGINTFPRKIIGDNLIIVNKPGKEIFNFKTPPPLISRKNYLSINFILLSAKKFRRRIRNGN